MEIHLIRYRARGSICHNGFLVNKPVFDFSTDKEGLSIYLNYIVYEQNEMILHPTIWSLLIQIFRFVNTEMFINNSEYCVNAIQVFGMANNSGVLCASLCARGKMM